MVTKTETLAAALEKRRTELGHSQTEAAVAMGVTQSSYNRWVNDLYDPPGSDATVRALRRYLDASVEQLAVLLLHQKMERFRRTREQARQLGR